MKPGRQSQTILMADDDDDDRLLVSDAFRQSQVPRQLQFVKDGEELMEYLQRRGKYQGLHQEPLPLLILLDLNMPRKDGREALKEIKADPRLRTIPIVVLTTSDSDEDVHRSYDLGVNSFIIKPASFEGLVEAMTVLRRYWFEVVTLPPCREQA